MIWCWAEFDIRYVIGFAFFLVVNRTSQPCGYQELRREGGKGRDERMDTARREPQKPHHQREKVEHRTQRTPGHTAEPWGSLLVAWAAGMPNELNKKQTYLSRPSPPSAHRPTTSLLFLSQRTNRTPTNTPNRAKTDTFHLFFHVTFTVGRLGGCGIVGFLPAGAWSMGRHEEESHEKRM